MSTALSELLMRSSDDELERLRDKLLRLRSAQLRKAEAERSDFLRRYPTPGALAAEYLPSTKQTPALDAIDTALVDLANAPDDRGRQMIFVPPQEGKPVVEWALILMGDGSRKRLADVQVGDTVITHRGRSRAVTAVHEQGTLPIVTITTHAGRQVSAAIDHPFLTPLGWVNAGDLAVGDVLAVVTSPDTTGSATLTPEEARLLGYFVGDGSVTEYVYRREDGKIRSKSSNCSITSFDDEETEDIRKCAASLGFTTDATERVCDSVESWTGSPVQRPQGRRARINVGGGARQWIRAHGLAGKTSHTKRVPVEMFTQPPRIVAEFIGAYFACDGTVSRRGSARPDARVEFNSVSRDLLADVQHLLLRLGIQTTVRRKMGRYNGEPHESWRLLMRRQDDVHKFAALVPIHNAKAKVLGDWPLRRTAFDAPLAEDPIEAIDVGETAACRCLTVDEDHTFTAEDLVVHNSTRTSCWFPLWMLAQDPTLRVAIISYSATKAERWGKWIRKMIQRHPELGIELEPGSQAVDNYATTAGGSVISVGISGGITGEPVDVMVIDDPLRGRAEAESPTYRRTAKEWWESNGSTRLSSRGRVVLMLTRWHADDLAGWLMQAEPGVWKVLRIPAIREPDRPLVRGSDGASVYAPNGELISVQGRRPGYYLELKGRRSLYVWNSIYMQTPVAAEGNLFPRADFRYWFPLERDTSRHDATGGRRILVDHQDDRTDRVYLGDCTRFLTVDLAAKEKTSADWTVASVWAITPDGWLILLDRRRARIAEANHWQLVKPLVRLWAATTVYVEKGFIGSTLVIQATKGGVHVEPVTPDKDKVTRALPATHLVRAHEVFFPGRAEWLDEWSDEVAGFPTAEHDDQVDTFSYAARIKEAHWLAADKEPPGQPEPPSDADRAYLAATGVPAGLPSARWDY